MCKMDMVVLFHKPFRNTTTEALVAEGIVNLNMARQVLNYFGFVDYSRFRDELFQECL